MSRPARFDPVSSNSTRFQSGLNAKNVPNKQEFAQVFSRSMRNQTHTPQNKTEDQKQQAKRSTNPSAPPQSSKRDSVQEARQAKQNAPSSGAKTENGSNLPQHVQNGDDRQESTNSDYAATKLAPDTQYPDESVPQQEVVFQETKEFFSIPIPVLGLTSGAGLETSLSSSDVAGQPIPVTEPGQCSSGLETASGALLPAVNNSTNTSTASALVNNIPLQLAVVDTALAEQAVTVPQPPGQSPAQVLPTDKAGVAPVEQLIANSQTALGEPQPEESTELETKSRGTLDNLLLAATGEKNTKEFLIQTEKHTNKLTNQRAMATGIPNPTQAEDNDVLAESMLRRESVLFKDQLLAVAQHNSPQASNTTANEFNNLLARQTDHLPLVSADQQLGDTSLHVKEPSVSPRQPGNPFQVFSPMLQMSSTPGHKSWSNEVGQRVMWMVNTDLQQAQLHLNPKHLGPLEVKISMTADQQINVNFLTHNSAVKDALDQALPRLREVFDQSGLNLNDASVRQESNEQNRQQHHTSEQTSTQDPQVAEARRDEIEVAQIFHSQGMSSSLVDFYA